jgi:hypothetical protein
MMSEKFSTEDQAFLKNLRRGLTMGEFFALSDADVERAAQLLMADENGYMGFGPLHFLEELDRRATDRHANQVEIYAERLDKLTRWLAALTIALLILTALLLVFEVWSRFFMER